MKLKELIMEMIGVALMDIPTKNVKSVSLEIGVDAKMNVIPLEKAACRIGFDVEKRVDLK